MKPINISDELQILQISHLELMTGFHRSSLRRFWEDNQFPRPRKMKGGTLIWSRQIIQEWIEKLTGL